MNALNIFCGEISKNMEEQRDVQSPLIKRNVSAKTSPTPDETATKLSDNLRRTVSAPRSHCLSVTDLLAQAEQHSETFSKMFPLIDKNKFKSRQTSSETDSDDISEMRQTDYSKEKSACQTFENRLSRGRERFYTTLNEDGATCSPSQRDDVFLQNDRAMGISDALLPPTNAAKSPSTAWLGVQLEYIIRDNKLKVSVSKFGGENLDSDRKRKVAKVCLMPGNIQSQKIDVSSTRGKFQKSEIAYFSGIDAKGLNMEMHFEIFIKQGLFKKDKMILDFSFHMKDIDLMKPPIVWKSF